MPPRQTYRASARRSSGRASILAIAVFLLIYAFAALHWQVPALVGGWYLAGSALCFIAYAMDKAAARAGRWRIAESTLIALGLAGGWPGAIVAQQMLRHKSSKASFRASFWASVGLNIGAFLAFYSPWLTLLKA